jgi:hypothetical protein
MLMVYALIFHTTMSISAIAAWIRGVIALDPISYFATARFSWIAMPSNVKHGIEAQDYQGHQ